MKHRKLLSILSAALLGLSAAVFPPDALEPVELVAKADQYTTKAQYKTPEGLLMNKSGSTLYIVGYTGSDMNVKVPSKYEGMKVTAIAARGLEGIKLKTIDLPDTIESIGKYAFRNCTELTKIVIPEKVTLLEAQTFYNCKKMKSAEIKGEAEIQEKVFMNCKALKEVQINPKCKRGVSAAGKKAGLEKSRDTFTNCVNLEKVNGVKMLGHLNGVEPILNGNAQVKKVVGKFMIRSESVGFVMDYIHELWDYIPQYKLLRFGSQAVRARQIHDWLVDNCKYMTEGTKYGEVKDAKHNIEFHSVTGLFLSYGLEGVGETVCDGYAAAFQMLAKYAHIESYMLINDEEDHAWNLAKLDGNWYHLDCTWDDQIIEKKGESYRYRFFMKTTAQMERLDDKYLTQKVHRTDLTTTEEEFDQGVAGLELANVPYTDTNHDGIRDGDWNFDGKKNSEDTKTYKILCKALDVTSVPESDLKNFLLCLTGWRWSVADFCKAYQ